MKRTVITLLLAATLASAALGQESTDPMAAPEDPNVPSTAVQSGAPVELTTEPEATDVQIVLLSSLPKDGTPAEMSEDADELATLHASIEDNAPVKIKLEADGYAVEDVAAMATTAEGAVIVYVDDRG